METLLEAWPHLSLETNASTKQRKIVCRKGIKFGDLVFRSKIAAATLHRKHYGLMCFSCKRFHEDLGSPLRVRCEVCRCTYYCSSTCLERDKAFHSPHCHLLHHINSDKKLKKEETSFVLLLLRLLSRLSLKALIRMQNEEQTAHEESPTVLDGINLTHILSMMKDHKGVSGFKRRAKQREKAASYFVNLMRTQKQCKIIKPESNSGYFHKITINEQLKMLPDFLSVKNCVNILSSGPLNEFALFDVDGEAVGCGYFPLAAMCNHSCVPTASVQIEGEYMTFYATKDICVGEEITQSYANLGDDGKLTRQENIQASWGFVCKCLRCEVEKRIVDQNDTKTLSQGNDESETLKKLKCGLETLKEFDAVNVCSCGAVVVPEAKRGKRAGDNCQCNCFNLISSDSKYRTGENMTKHLQGQ